MEDLIDQYEHIFTDMPGDSYLTEDQIGLTSDEPVRSKPYTIPYNVRESLKDVLQMDVIRVEVPLCVTGRSRSQEGWHKYSVRRLSEVESSHGFRLDTG